MAQPPATGHQDTPTYLPQPHIQWQAGGTQGSNMKALDNSQRVDMPQKWPMLLVTPKLIYNLLSPLKRPLGFRLTHCHQKPVGKVNGRRGGPWQQCVGLGCGVWPCATGLCPCQHWDSNRGRSYLVRQSMWKILISLAQFF